MSFLSAIPVIGDLINGIGDAVDKNVTTDHERLTVKAKMMEIAAPAMIAVVQAQTSANELTAKIAELEARSEDRLVRWRRPILALAAAGNFMIVLWWWLLTSPINVFELTDIPAIVSYSFTFAALVNGLDIGTRGLEKMVGKWSSRANGEH